MLVSLASFTKKIFLKEWLVVLIRVRDDVFARLKNYRVDIFYEEHSVMRILVKEKLGSFTVDRLNTALPPVGSCQI